VVSGCRARLRFCVRFSSQPTNFAYLHKQWPPFQPPRRKAPREVRSDLNPDPTFLIKKMYFRVLESAIARAATFPPVRRYHPTSHANIQSSFIALHHFQQLRRRLVFVASARVHSTHVSTSPVDPLCGPIRHRSTFTPDHRVEYLRARLGLFLCPVFALALTFAFCSVACGK
jgi:hypothetical protein